MPDALPVLPTPSSQEEVRARNAQRHELLRRLDSKQATIRAQAIEECQILPASEIWALIGMADETNNPQHLNAQMRTFALILFGAVLGIPMLFWANSFPLFILLCLIVLFLVYSSPNMHSLYSARLQDSLAVIVSNTHDPALLPEAMRVLNSMRPVYSQGMTPLRQALFDKSADFLQRLDIAQIRSYRIQQQALCLFLEPDIRHNVPHTAIRVLNYLEQYGTSSALSQVAGVANARSSRQEDMKVRDAAWTCLAALQQRSRESSQPQMLLRASAAPVADPDALLRPTAAQISPSEPDRLLRPADSRQSSPPISGKIINGNSET